MPKDKEEKERKKIAELRSRLHDILKVEYEDYDLRKWLKARSFDVDKAELMFRNSTAYKKKIKVETLMSEYEKPEVVKRYLTGGFCGHDKDGSPIRVELYGHLDMKGLMASCRRSDLEKTKVMQCEWTVQEWKRMGEKLGRRVDGLTVIMDMEGVTTRMMWRPGMQMYLHLVKVLEDNYPEMLKRLFVINAPAIFPILYKLARPLISDEMRNKIHVLGSNYKNDLLKYIDADQLPAFLGGTLTDPDGDPRCKTMICQGGDVPEKYYQDVRALYEQMGSVTIAAGTVHTREVIVNQPGATLTWAFRSEEYDMGFGVQLVQDSGKAHFLVPLQRVNSHLVAEDGAVVCDQPGTYKLVFDNSFSWTRAKKVYYEYDIIAVDADYVRSEISDLVEAGDWDTLEQKFETTHL
ncbi:retinal-binding protein-like [Mya arenaria]|uniref:retinal-binding protein-like n=1 Tax=Mya arenaria TaxID=6604 RepID=UPI0022DEDC72|nr:retinal-binding protein-like [Mya arenaria]XP_052799684.1 retinal-binding protein-like [Mya arenaria]XP_052799685.1 retinal-binding protein-like [Mya arenaria]XP_052799686.1 retinal-binding protein-like [Mya arenaria]